MLLGPPPISYLYYVDAITVGCLLLLIITGLVLVVVLVYVIPPDLTSSLVVTLLFVITPAADRVFGLRLEVVVVVVVVWPARGLAPA